MKGIARGLGGIVLKPGAGKDNLSLQKAGQWLIIPIVAIWGLPGYTFKGIYKELQKLFGPSTQNYIIAARTAQGFEDLQSCAQRERADIINRWQSLQEEIRRAKQTFAEETRQTVTEYRVKRQQTVEEFKKRRKEKRGSRDAQKTETHAHLHPRSRPLLPRLLHSHSFPGASPIDAKHPQIEEAIQTSVAETSKGDAEQDELIERAIRASVNELLTAQHEQVEEHEALHRTIQASVLESRRIGENEESSGEKSGIIPADDEEALREALYRSLPEYHLQGQHGHEQINHPAHGDDEDFQRAMEESKLTHSRQEEAEARARAEDEILLEHVKRQSLVDEEEKKHIVQAGRSDLTQQRNPEK